MKIWINFLQFAIDPEYNPEGDAYKTLIKSI
jgi:hypothetical protein